MNNNEFSMEVFNKFFIDDFPQFSDFQIEFFDQIDSTNNYAKKLLTECKSSSKTKIIIAFSQTNGRGRIGRTFFSPKNTGIYISLIYSPKNQIINPARITAFSSVAVCNAINTIFKIEPKIKWINDIYFNQKKIAGILTEGIVDFQTQKIQSAIIGIGINILPNEDCPKELQNKVGSILQQGEFLQKNQKEEFVAQICGKVFSILEKENSKIIKEYRKLSFLIGKEVLVIPIIDNQKSSYKAKVLNITDEAFLQVQLQNGEQKILQSGEVSLQI